MGDDALKEKRFATRAIHVGETREDSAVPICQAEWTELGYARGGNPTIRALEERVASLGDAATLVLKAWDACVRPERGMSGSAAVIRDGFRARKP